MDKGRSLNSYVFTVGGCAVSCRVCLQPTIVLSTIEAKYIASCDACKEAVWLKGQLECILHYAVLSTIKAVLSIY